ncbi:MAG: zinc-binding dehydrogenase [bacterium]|nr:zinc-binding dehydrogenase [bacterium]
MQAIYFKEHGGLDKLKYGRRSRPEPGPGWVRIALRASALNHLDLFVLGGLPGVPINLPHVGGADGVGTIDAVGQGVVGVEVDEPVVFDPGISCGDCEFCLRGEHSLCIRFGLVGEHCEGTFAEYAVVPASGLAAKPSHLNWEEAAAFPLTFITSWRMLVSRGCLGPGETVLIHGIGGGVALACLQIAKAMGARVYVTSSSASKLERALELGADAAFESGSEVVKDVRKATQKRGVDLVVDSVGAATWSQSIRSAAKGGRIVTCGATSGPNPEEEVRLVFWNQLTILGSTMGSRSDWRRMVEFLCVAELRPVVDSVLDLEQGADAYRRLQDGAQFGKIVLRNSA